MFLGEVSPKVGSVKPRTGKGGKGGFKTLPNQDSLEGGLKGGVFADLSTLLNRRAALRYIMDRLNDGVETVGAAAVGQALIAGIKAAGLLEAEMDLEILREALRESKEIMDRPDLPAKNKAALARKRLASAEKLAIASGNRRA